jgi:hypothetical protein
MKVSTVEHYQSASALMLKSKVLACMLPLFVALNVGVMEQLLNDEKVVERWEALIQEQRDLIEVENGDEGGEMMETEGREVFEGVVGPAKSHFNENNVVKGGKEEQTVSNSPFNEIIEELFLGEEDLTSRHSANNNGPDDLLHLIDDPCDCIDRGALEGVEKG